MGKKILILLITLVLVLAGLLIYLNTYFIPVRLKGLVTQRAREFLSRDVTFRKISYHPVKGIVVRDLIIYQKDDPRTPFLQVEEAHGNVLLAPLLKNKSIVVPSLTVVRPVVRLVQDKNGTWNFSDLLKRRPKKSKSPFTFYLGSFALRDGYLRLDDVTPEGTDTEILEDIQARAGLSIKKGISFEAETVLLPRLNPDAAAQKGFLKIKGMVALPSRSWSLRLLAGNLDVLRYMNYFPERPGFEIRKGFIPLARMQIKRGKKSWQIGGDLSALIDLVFPSGLQVKGRVTADKAAFAKDAQTLSLTGAFDAEDATMVFPDEKTLRAGRIHLHDIAVKQGDELLEASGNLEGSQVSGLWEKGRTFKGNVALTGASFRRSREEFDATGNLRLRESEIIAAPDIEFHGDLAAESFGLTSRSGTTGLKGTLRIENGDIRLLGNRHITGNFTAKDTHLNMAGEKLTADTNIEAGPVTAAYKKLSYRGNPVIIAHVTYDPGQSPALKYSGSMILDNAAVTGLPRLDTATQITGRIDFKTNHFSTHYLDLVAMETPVRVSGSLEDLRAPKADLQLSVPKADLAELVSLLPRRLQKTDILPNGQADLKVTFKGPVDSPQTASITAVASLRNVTVTGLKVPGNLPGEITGISGVLTYKDHGLTWENLKATYDKDAYFLNGTMNNFSSPSIKTSISSSRFNFSAWLQINGNLITIPYLKGSYLNTALDINGEVQQDHESPYLDLKGKITLDLADLPILVPALKKQFGVLKPAGIADIEARFKGRPGEVKNAMITATALIPSLKISKYAFDDVVLNLEHGYMNISKLNARSSFYKGRLTAASSFDIKKPALPFRLSAQLEDTDLTALRKGLGIKGEVAGNLTAHLNTSGSLKEVDTLEGAGDITISDGLIWKLKILEGIWRLLFVPEFEGVTFTDALASFTIKGRKISSDDIWLKGQTADMKGRGWIDFDKNIDFTVSPVFKESEIITTKLIQKSLSALLAQTDGYISIRIGGTLDKPNYSVETFPTKMLQKATGNLLKGVGEVLQDIMQ